MLFLCRVLYSTLVWCYSSFWSRSVRSMHSASKTNATASHFKLNLVYHLNPNILVPSGHHSHLLFGWREFQLGCNDCKAVTLDSTVHMSWFIHCELIHPLWADSSTVSWFIHCELIHPLQADSSTSSWFIQCELINPLWADSSTVNWFIHFELIGPLWANLPISLLSQPLRCFFKNLMLVWLV